MENLLSPIFDDSIMVKFDVISIYYAASILMMIILNKSKNKASFSIRFKSIVMIIILNKSENKSSFSTLQNKKSKKVRCVGRESNPGQLLGRQLCSPLYHRRLR